MNSATIRCRLIGMLALVISGIWIASAAAQQPAFNIVKPSTTGVPGEEVRVMKFDLDGNLWIAGRFYFWGEGGLAMLSADQLDYQPLPGGGFDTGAWKVWSSVHHPIPSPYINDMEFGAGGVIWIASDGGLTRFDPAAPTEAQRWFTYTPANSPLILNDVHSLALDSQGNLWLTNVSVQSSNGALFRFNPTSNMWTQYRVGQELPWSPPWYNVNAVLVSADDHVWLTHSVLGGMAEFNGTSWVLHDSPYQMDAMLADVQGNIWVRTSQYGLFKWNGSSWQNWPTVGGTITMTGLGTDRDGVVYVSTWYGGIYKMINDNPVFFVDADNIPRPVIGRPNGDIWINNYGGNATLGTVRQYTASGQLLRRMQTFNSGLPDYFVDRITHDSAGNMWFATGEAGLSRMLGSNGAPDAATHWRNWGNHNDLSEPYPWAGNEPMYSVFEDTGGIFWMGGNGVGRWDSATGQFTDFWNWQNSNLDSSGHHAIAKRAGTMWVGSGGSGVYWFDDISWNHVTLSPGGYSYESNNVRSMTVDTDNNLWVASEYGLRKFEAGNNTTFTVYDTSNTPLTSAGMTDVEADPNGGIWLGTYEGFARFDGTTWTLYNHANTGMPGSVVADVARRSSDGLIAIASNQGSTWPYTGGVSTFDGTTWTHYTPENSPLTHWQVVAVEFDGDGNLWASALSEGVVQILIGTAAPPSPTPTPVATPTPTPVATPTPAATSTPTPGTTPTPSATPSSTPISTATPTVSPPATKAINLSTRMLVQTGDNVGIGGFIITGSAPKRVLVRAIGPSLTGFGLPDALADPVLELHGPGTFTTITNDNWRQTQEVEIQATGIAPTDDFEAAIMAMLAPGAYTAIMRGNGNTSGVALVEVYDLNQEADSKLANLSTRAFVRTGDNIVIAGFMLGGNSADDTIVVRGIGPSLTAAGLPDALADPVLELRDTNGTLLIANNDWQDNTAQAAELTAAGLAPTNSLESGMAATLPPGPYTALLAGLNNGTGIGVVEIYERGAP